MDINEMNIQAMSDEMLNEVAGGKAMPKDHIEIINCKNCCNVRSSASSKSPDNIIGKAYLGDNYVFYGWSGRWAKIQFGARKGYVYQDFVGVLD